ncbi:MAG: 7-cyano-7-deazaguanine synthase [Candidatus Sericytochromatia bacterium]
MIGPWPSPPPFTADARAALWLDGGLESAVAAYMLDRAGLTWLALLPAGAPEEAMAIAAALGAPTVTLPVAGPLPRLSAWAAASEAAAAEGARWLVTGLSESPGEPPLPLRLLAVETAIRAHGLEGVYAPLLGYTPIEVGRLALALGVPFERTRDCRASCGECEACRRRALTFHHLGMVDPAAPNS